MTHAHRIYQELASQSGYTHLKLPKGLAMSIIP